MSRFRLVRDFAALSGGELVSKVAGFLAFAYLARVLEPEAYGAVELAAAMALFFALVVDFGFGPIGAREIAREPGRAAELAARVPAGRLLLALLAFPLMGLTGLVLGQPPETVLLIWLFAGSLLFAPWVQRWLLQGLEMMSWVSGAQALRMVVFAMGVVLFVGGREDLLRVGAIEIGAAASMALYFAWVQRSRITSLRLSFRLDGLRKLAREALPVGVEQLVWALNQYLPTVLVAVLLGGADLAWFGGAHRLVLSLGSFVWLYHFNLYPTLARSTGDGGEAVGALVGPSLRVTAWGSIGLALGLALLADPIARTAFGEAFASAGLPFAVLIWALPLGLLSGHARFGLIAAGEQTRELWAQVVGALVTVGVGVAAITALGPVGGAVAMLASNLAVWLVAHRAMDTHVAAIPFLGPVWRPALWAAALAGGALWFDAPSPWISAPVAGLLFLAGAPLLDRSLLGDLRRLAGAKGGPGTPELAHEGEVR
ncbi:MAG: hypothetical protein CL910_16095 [Deltaproteobacteria bacterium]|jgi:O-antigen/teichoic acid export membrane protein|nr:hypothetical protein [Deltaproteobacteria bacterium]